MVMLSPAELPAPETLIDYGDGAVGAAMFHYTSEGDDMVAIAHDNGFDIAFLSLEDDGDSEALYERSLEGANVLAEWYPTVPPDWFLGGKWEADDGPIAVFLRPRDSGTTIQPTVSDVGRA
jgi:hypothetical protein